MSIKSFVNNKTEWDAFLEELETFIKADHVRMEQASDSQELFKLQGSVQAYRKLKKLRDIVNGRD